MECEVRSVIRAWLVQWGRSTQRGVWCVGCLTVTVVGVVCCLSGCAFFLRIRSCNPIRTWSQCYEIVDVSSCRYIFRKPHVWTLACSLWSWSFPLRRAPSYSFYSCLLHVLVVLSVPLFRFLFPVLSLLIKLLSYFLIHLSCCYLSLRFHTPSWPCSQSSLHAFLSPLCYTIVLAMLQVAKFWHHQLRLTRPMSCTVVSTGPSAAAAGM